MKKNLLLILTAILFQACSSFDPYPITYTNAVENPDALFQDSLYVYARPFGGIEDGVVTKGTNVSFAETTIPVNGISFSVSNRSSKELSFELITQANAHVLSDDEIYSTYSKSGFGNFLAISSPWVINLALKAPVYYGIAFPIMGLIEASSAASANTKLESYIKDHKLPEKIPAHKTVNGLFFVKGRLPSDLKINFYTLPGKQFYSIVPITLK